MELISFCPEMEIKKKKEKKMKFDRMQYEQTRFVDGAVRKP